MTTMEELRRVIFAMNLNSSPDLDGIGGKFYRTCFDIIKVDFVVVCQYLLNGQDMYKHLTHACLILLPKTHHLNKRKDF